MVVAQSSVLNFERSTQQWLRSFELASAEVDCAQVV